MKRQMLTSPESSSSHLPVLVQKPTQNVTHFHICRKPLERLKLCIIFSSWKKKKEKSFSLSEISFYNRFLLCVRFLFLTAVIQLIVSSNTSLSSPLSKRKNLLKLNRLGYKLTSVSMWRQGQTFYRALLRIQGPFSLSLFWKHSKGLHIYCLSL